MIESILPNHQEMFISRLRQVFFVWRFDLFLCLLTFEGGAGFYY